MRLTFATIIFIWAAGVISMPAICAYNVPAEQVDLRCYWWRPLE